MRFFSNLYLISKGELNAEMNVQEVKGTQIARNLALPGFRSLVLASE